jgi:hypothetical protein
MKLKSKTPVEQASLANEFIVQLQEGQIRHRAFELYEKRGREQGHDLDDWLRAESEFAQRQVKSTAA